jgi:hypothetical protein
MENIGIDKGSLKTKITKRSNNGEKDQKVEVTAVASITIGSYTLNVYPGGYSAHDILMKYCGPYNLTKQRTPKHLHWMIDTLIKKQARPEIADKYLERCQSFWQEEARPLENNDFEHIKDLLNEYLLQKDYFEIKSDIENLSNYGEFPIEFSTALFILLATEEKTNLSTAYMFGKIITQLLVPLDHLDVSRLVSTTAYRGMML